jgi:hypothetical protein
MSLLGYTTLRTIKNSEGQHITWHPEQLKYYFYTVAPLNLKNLPDDEKFMWFEAGWKHIELLRKIYAIPKLNSGCSPEAVMEVIRNPIEEYEHLLSIEPDADMTTEQWQLKVDLQKERKEWFEQYIANQ